MGVFILISQYFWIEMCFTPEFAEMNFIKRVLYYCISMSGKRFFYYGPFSFATGACQSTGLGWNGNGKWDKIVGVYVWDIETADSVMVMLRAWNH